MYFFVSLQHAFVSFKQHREIEKGSHIFIKSLSTLLSFIFNLLQCISFLKGTDNSDL